MGQELEKGDVKVTALAIKNSIQGIWNTLRCHVVSVEHTKPTNILPNSTISETSGADPVKELGSLVASLFVMQSPRSVTSKPH